MVKIEKLWKEIYKLRNKTSVQHSSVLLVTSSALFLKYQYVSQCLSKSPCSYFYLFGVFFNCLYSNKANTEIRYEEYLSSFYNLINPCMKHCIALIKQKI